MKTSPFLPSPKNQNRKFIEMFLIGGLCGGYDTLPGSGGQQIFTKN